MCPLANIEHPHALPNTEHCMHRISPQYGRQASDRFAPHFPDITSICEMLNIATNTTFSRVSYMTHDKVCCRRHISMRHGDASDHATTTAHRTHRPQPTKLDCASRRQSHLNRRTAIQVLCLHNPRSGLHGQLPYQRYEPAYAKTTAAVTQSSRRSQPRAERSGHDQHPI